MHLLKLKSRVSKFHAAQDLVNHGVLDAKKRLHVLSRHILILFDVCLRLVC